MFRTCQDYIRDEFKVEKSCETIKYQVVMELKAKITQKIENLNLVTF